MTVALTYILDNLSTDLGATLGIERLDGGLCNRLYRLSTAQGRFALRCNHQDSAALGVDREQEKAILAVIAKKIWSPEVLECDQAWLLTRWVEGVTPNHGEETDMARLTHLIRSVHHQRPDTPVLNMAKRLKELVSAGPRWPEPAASGLESILHQYCLPESHCLCHNDWHPGNLIQSDNHWVLLDWEYAALGDPAMDVAAACQGFSLTDAHAAALANDLSIDFPRLIQARAIMEAIALAWYRLLPGQNHATEDTPDAWWLRWQSRVM